MIKVFAITIMVLAYITLVILYTCVGAIIYPWLKRKLLDKNQN